MVKIMIEPDKGKLIGDGDFTVPVFILLKSFLEKKLKEWNRLEVGDPRVLISPTGDPLDSEIT